MKSGRFADSSFNSNIVSLTVADLLYLLEKCKIKSSDNVRKIRIDIEKGEKEFEKSIIESLQDLSVEALKETLRPFMSDKLIDKLDVFAKSIIKSAKNYLNKK